MWDEGLVTELPGVHRMWGVSSQALVRSFIRTNDGISKGVSLLCFYAFLCSGSFAFLSLLLYISFPYPSWFLLMEDGFLGGILVRLFSHLPSQFSSF